MLRRRNESQRTFHAVLLAALLAGLFTGTPAKAEGSLSQALSSTKSFTLYENTPNETGNFALESGFFSGRASGSMTLNDTDQALTLDHDSRMYALLIDGNYDFINDSEQALHPYVGGSVGMAVYGRPGEALTSGGEAVPLFRLGGGIAYRLGAQWNLSLDYKAGFAGHAPDQMFTGRGEQPIDLHVLNMGVRYQF